MRSIRDIYWDARRYGLAYAITEAIGDSPLRSIFELSALPSQRELLHAAVDNVPLIIVLDACRFDFFVFEFPRLFGTALSGCNYILFRVQSAGNNTFEWVRRTWPNYYDVYYVSAATPINSVTTDYSDVLPLHKLYRGYVPREHFAKIVDTWDWGWDDSLGTVPAPPVVADALRYLRRGKPVIAHFFQPHSPYIGEPKLLGATGKTVGKLRGTPPDLVLWEKVRRSEISPEQLRAAYRGNLRYVLKYALTLIKKSGVDIVVITADHGELLGEFNKFGHGYLYPHRELRCVPFAIIWRREHG